MTVVDASITLSWYFDDEKSLASDQVLDAVGKLGATVPGHWRLEVANSLRTAVRRGRATSDYRDAVLQQLSNLPIAIDSETAAHAWAGTLALADKHRLTPYDAAYLELALRRNLPLATLDNALQSAAQTEGVNVLPRTL
ncbi:type II toxin-antitoxin system VapC family toxin [Mesorhizobium sp. KR9-304]|uniref:type II toxin-antitoxin system VapC family toxin n=1 Tax=Mesorhizobium sp. KR9-304 TaxID=3156614 RepID=UPI0032B43755